MEVTGQESQLLKVDGNAERWPEKSCSRRTSRKFEHYVNSEIGSVMWLLDYEKSVGETAGHK